MSVVLRGEPSSASVPECAVFFQVRHFIVELEFRCDSVFVQHHVPNRHFSVEVPRNIKDYRYSTVTMQKNCNDDAHYCKQCLQSHAFHNLHWPQACWQHWVMNCQCLYDRHVWKRTTYLSILIQCKSQAAVSSTGAARNS